MGKNHEVDFLVFEKFIETIVEKHKTVDPRQKIDCHINYKQSHWDRLEEKLNEQFPKDEGYDVPRANTIKNYFYIVRPGNKNFGIVKYLAKFVDTLSNFIECRSYQEFYDKTAAELNFLDTPEKLQSGNSQKKVEEALSTSQSHPLESKIEAAIDKQAILLGQLRENSNSYRNSLLSNRGRFQHVRIEEILLADASITSNLPTEVKNRDKQLDLFTAIKSLGKKDIPHAIILGSGGMGKTMSLLYLWERLLKEKNQPIPLFIALNEYNNAPKKERKNFILQYIAHHYLVESSPTKKTENLIWNLLKKKPEKEQLGIVLLLDGFNEVTTDLDELIWELSKLSTEALNVQMVVTSRYVEIQNYTWARNSEVMELVHLEKNTISDYLSEHGVSTPTEDSKLFELLGNPMMLTLYVGTEQISREYSDHSLFSFFKVQTEAELLWNFNESLLAKSFKEFESKRKEYFFAAFLIRYVVSYIAWKMEKEGVFFISSTSAKNSKFNFNTVIREACEKLNRRSILEKYSDVPKVVNLFSEQTTNVLSDIQRSKEIKNYLTHHLNILVQEGTDLRFLHQNFRDFYAACHLRNCITFSLSEQKRPMEWEERTFPIYLRKMLGEMEGEYLFDAQELLQGQEPPSRIKENLITHLLDSCRGQNMTNNYTVWNLVSILHEVRATLAGSDLRQLDLACIALNNIPLTAYRGKKYLTVRIEEAKVNGKQFICQSHTSFVNSIEYRLPDGQRILSASKDGTIKEWLVSTGLCLNTFSGHKAGVVSAVYSPDNHRILSSSWDRTVKEWSTTGICLYTINKHTRGVLSAIYNSTGERFITGSRDGAFEWKSILGQKIRTIKKSFGQSYFAAYSPYDDRILINSGGVKIDEWSEKDKTWLSPFKFHRDGINFINYSPDGQTVLSASQDGTIKTWSVATRQCLNTSEKHFSGVLYASYSPDGQYIISTYYNGTIKEWSASTLSCLKTLEITRSNERIIRAIYSPDGLKILVLSGDGIIREWLRSTWECISTIQPLIENEIKFAEYSPFGRQMLLISKNGTAKEFSTFKGQCLKIFQLTHSNIQNAIYSPNGDRILTLGQDGTICEWSVTRGNLLRTLKFGEERMLSIAYSRDGKKIISLTSNNSISSAFSYHKELFSHSNSIAFEWHEGFSSPFRKIVFKGSNVKHIIYLNNDTHFLTVSFNGTVEIRSLDGVTLSNLSTLEGFDSSSSIKFSMAGKKVIATDSKGLMIKGWSVSTGKLLFSESTDTVNNYIFTNSPNKQCIIFRTKDNTIIERSLVGEPDRRYLDDFGLIVQGVNFRNLHPDSIFTDEEKKRLRHYGAIFDDQDELDWNKAVEDAYGDMEEE
ncbi:hypothetical protein IFO69_10690 [Echinicola sp. CAU 1574]|uniref:WD40 repeat-containing protein n=1 Tax=Echinicola arenosa TaxID=2774144 RepID=A0ABR9ALG6_9BACT|nr:hypothetical protein [Echinicola arenosa]MBD8489212.1 hypothetical protein [Echinicola arenosa]